MKTNNFEHRSVLLKESVDKLNVKSNGIYVDGTLGKGGHSKEILKKLDSGKLIGIDQDENAIRAARENLLDYEGKFTLVRDNFANVENILKTLKIAKIDGFLLDLGVSSHQFDEAERGFSYRFDAKLDMRMDTRKEFSAWNIVNEYSKDQLAKIFWEHSDERWSKRIAEFIVESRNKKEINTTLELVEIIKNAIPLSVRKNGSHPAKRVFQAIRMEVNDELNKIENAIKTVCNYMAKKGRIAIISFHSIEDRLVKKIFKELENPCICPSDFPVCNCQKKSVLKIIKPQVIAPSEKEILDNPRSKSAKLRIAEMR